MFSFLAGYGTVALRLSHELEVEFRSQYVSGPVSQSGRTMRDYSSTPAQLLDETEVLRHPYCRARDWIGSLKPKATKRATPQANKKS